MIQRIATLIRLELKLEFRQRASMAGVLLFSIGTVYLFSLAFGHLEPRLWTALFWIVLLFGATNGLSNAFRRELTYRHAYYHQLAPPLAIYLSKVVFNTIFLLIIGMLVWLLLILFFGNPVVDNLLFFSTLLLACSGLSLLLTFLALLAGRVPNGAGMVAILAFPTVIPLLLTVVKLGAVSTRVIAQTSTSKDLLVLVGIDLLAIGLALILVPMLWKEA